MGVMDRYSKIYLSLVLCISNIKVCTGIGENWSERNCFDYCATKVDGNGNGMEIEICGPDCLSHEQTMTRKVVETFKMTLQYDNSVTEIGMELYGYLMTGIFVIGLTLATLLPATSKIFF